MKNPYVMKKCSKCNNWLVANTKNFHRAKSNKYGLKTKCKRCINSTTRTVFEPNEIIVHNNFAEILLYNRKGIEVARAIINIEDVERVKAHKWHLNSTGYAMTKINNKLIGLHRFILDYNGNLQIDHKNMDKLDNRKDNLRIVTNQQNSFNKGIRSNNKSGKTGVFFCNTCKKWIAKIRIDNKAIHLGSYNTFEEAVKARIEGEIKYFGEYRRK